MILENENISEEKHLITIEKNKILDVFTKPDKLETLILNLKSKILSIKNDVNTSEGRQEIISLGYKIARTKTYIDTIGKDLVAEYKEIPKKIDAIRKKSRDLLDDLKEEIKNPLDIWQKEQEKIANQIDIFNKWDEAHLMNDAFIEDKKQKELLVEAERLQREEEIKREAITKAEIQAKHDLEKQQKQHEREIALKEIEKMEAVNEERKKAKEQAFQLDLELKKQERIKQDEKIKKELESEKQRQIELFRQSNAEHKKNIQENAIVSLILNVGINSDLAKKIIEAIDENLIDNVQIKY